MATKSFILSDTFIEPQIIHYGKSSPTFSTSIDTYIIRETGASLTYATFPMMAVQQPSLYSIVNRSTNKSIKINKLEYVSRPYQNANSQVYLATGTAAVGAARINLNRISAHTKIESETAFDVFKLDSNSPDLPTSLEVYNSCSSITTVSTIKHIPYVRGASDDTLMTTALGALIGGALYSSPGYGTTNGSHNNIFSLYGGTSRTTPIVLRQNEGLAIAPVTALTIDSSMYITITLIYNSNTYIITTKPNWKYATVAALASIMNRETTAMYITKIEINLPRIGSAVNTTGVLLGPSSPRIFYSKYNYKTNWENYCSDNPNSFIFTPLALNSSENLSSGITCYKGLLPLCDTVFNQFTSQYVPFPIDYISPLSVALHKNFITGAGVHNGARNIAANNSFKRKNPIIINPKEVFTIGLVGASQQESYPPIEVYIEFTEEDYLVGSTNTEIAYGY